MQRILFLRMNISNPVESTEEAERLIRLYDNRLYEDVMEWIVTENRENQHETTEVFRSNTGECGCIYSKVPHSIN